MWDRGYLMVLLDTQGGAGAEHYLLVRSAGLQLEGSLWRARVVGPDTFLGSVPVERFSRRSASVQVGLSRLTFGASRSFYRWWVRTVYTGELCRRTCHDVAPNGEPVLQWRPGMSPTPSVPDRIPIAVGRRSGPARAMCLTKAQNPRNFAPSGGVRPAGIRSSRLLRGDVRAHLRHRGAPDEKAPSRHRHHLHAGSRSVGTRRPTRARRRCERQDPAAGPSRTRGGHPRLLRRRVRRSSRSEGRGRHQGMGGARAGRVPDAHDRGRSIAGEGEGDRPRHGRGPGGELLADQRAGGDRRRDSGARTTPRRPQRACRRSVRSGRSPSSSRSSVTPS